MLSLLRFSCSILGFSEAEKHHLSNKKLYLFTFFSFFLSVSSLRPSPARPLRVPLRSDFLLFLSTRGSVQRDHWNKARREPLGASEKAPLFFLRSFFGCQSSTMASFDGERSLLLERQVGASLRSRECNFAARSILSFVQWARSGGKMKAWGSAAAGTRRTRDVPFSKRCAHSPFASPFIKITATDSTSDTGLLSFETSLSLVGDCAGIRSPLVRFRRRAYLQKEMKTKNETKRRTLKKKILRFFFFLFSFPLL